MSKSSYKCIDISNYVKKRKFTFRPDLVMQLIYKRDQILPMLVQEKAKKYIVPIKDCVHCEQKRNNASEYILTKLSTRDFLCKKHTALYDYEQCKDKAAKIEYKDRIYYLFGEYIATPMPTDIDGLYVIWFGYIKQDKFSVFAINKKYFEGIENIQNDITKEILTSNAIQLNEWILVLDEHKPILEKINK
jgi:hypothetical protein